MERTEFCRFLLFVISIVYGHVGLTIINEIFYLIKKEQNEMSLNVVRIHIALGVFVVYLWDEPYYYNGTGYRF